MYIKEIEQPNRTIEVNHCFTSYRKCKKFKAYFISRLREHYRFVSISKEFK